MSYNPDFIDNLSQQEIDALISQTYNTPPGGIVYLTAAQVQHQQNAANRALWEQQKIMARYSQSLMDTYIQLTTASPFTFQGFDFVRDKVEFSTPCPDCGAPRRIDLEISSTKANIAFLKSLPREDYYCQACLENQRAAAGLPPTT